MSDRHPASACAIHGPRPRPPPYRGHLRRGFTARRYHLYHTILGIAQILFGSIVLLIEVIAFTLRPLLQFSFKMAVGLWAGIVFNIAGFLALLMTCGRCTKLSAKSVISAALVASFVSVFVSVVASVCIGMELASLSNKLGNYRYVHPMVERIFNFAYAKVSVQVTGCCAELIAASLHLVLCINNLCCRKPLSDQPVERRSRTLSHWPWSPEEGVNDSVFSVLPPMTAFPDPPPYDHPAHYPPPPYDSAEGNCCTYKVTDTQL